MTALQSSVLARIARMEVNNPKLCLQLLQRKLIRTGMVPTKVRRDLDLIAA
jgi:hypothetical protein